MTDLEDRLRARLRANAEAVQEGSIRPLLAPNGNRSRPVIRWLAPVLAAAAVIGVVTSASVISSASGNQPAAEASAGMPKYYVTLSSVFRGQTPALTVIVRVSATGATVGSRLVVRGRPGSKFLMPFWISGAASDRFFVIAARRNLYALRLAPDGRPVRLSRYRASISKLVPRLDRPGAQGALSPDGAHLAVPATSCANTLCRGGIEVISLATGATRTWLLPPGYPDFVAAPPAQPLNWTDNEHLFVTHTMVAEPKARPGDRLGYSLLDVTGRGGGLFAHSLRVASPDNQPGWLQGDLGLLTPDGRAVIMTDYQQSRGPMIIARVLEMSPRTGRLVRVLHVTSVHLSTLGFGPVCFATSAAHAGINVLLQCGSFGGLAGSHFTRLRGGLTAAEAGGRGFIHVSDSTALTETAAW